MSRLPVARWTRESRVLGPKGGAKPRRAMGFAAGQSGVPLTHQGISTVSGGISDSNPASEVSFRLPRAELSSTEENLPEEFSTTSGSTAATVHEAPSVENT